MIRQWPRTLASVGLVWAVGVACGSASDSSAPGGDGGKRPVDGGQEDSTAPGDDATFARDDADDPGDAGDEAATDDAGDATDDASPSDAAGGDASGIDDGGGAADGGTPADGGTAGDGGSGGDGGNASTGDAGTVSPTADGGSSCDFTGTWASAIRIDVTWAAGGIFDIVIAPGSGTIKQWLLSTRTVSGTAVTDSAVVCGIELPDFDGNPGLANETYGIRFPDSLFDSGNLAAFPIAGTISGSTPTATYATQPTAVLLGLTLAAPATDPWPATITTESDDDLDKKPGVTADVVPPSGGNGFSFVPLDFSVVTSPTTVPRADRLYLAIRQVTAISSTFTDCDDSSGSVTVPQLSDPTMLTTKYAIDSHVVGCGLAGKTTDCSANQTSFVDQNQPIFVPSATTFVSKRLPGGATCATVRAQFP
jgi:hypothetical protein